jgi:aspartate 1-decarboxylase
LKESLRKDNEEVQDLKAEIVVMNNENKQLKTKTKARTSVVTARLCD